MRLATPTGLQVVKKEEKEARLSAFIETVLAGEAEPGAFLLVARSAESPVVRALAQRAADLAAAGISVKAVLTSIDHTEFGEAIALPARLFCEGGLRLIEDPRLYDAHEQLVLGNDAVWIGDCMRREPAKRDSYERYTTGSAETATWARRAFERLWAASQPADHLIGEAASAATANVTPTIDPASLPAEGDSAQPMAATRH
ncbi:MAG: hypothetical protein NW205_10465 [Hyphomicrobiaceae bacterium]|nr:hypothetical protein [Hyphomicrobiaceae bacterium]